MRDISILSPQLVLLSIFDDYYSLIWAERYQDSGDFVLEVPISYDGHPYLIPGNILVVDGTNRFMVITDINPVVDDSNSKLIVKGVSGEGMLDWRVTTGPKNLVGSIQDSVLSLIYENIVSPTNASRTIPLFDYDVSDDPYILSVSTSIQFDQDSLLYIIRELCIQKNIGFKVEIDKVNLVMIFSLYHGTDRSHSQSSLPYVVFASEYENVLSSNYYISYATHQNVSAVVTDDPVEAFQNVFVYFDPEPSGVNRRERMVNAKDIRRSIPGDTDLTDLEVAGIIYSRGLTSIADNPPSEVFEGELDTDGPFKYGRDFFLGDIVQCNLNGRDIRARVTEVVTSSDESGTRTHVSFDFGQIFEDDVLSAPT